MYEMLHNDVTDWPIPQVADCKGRYNTKMQRTTKLPGYVL